ncbi:MAG: hypothetical protein VYA27_12190, partial [Verrucomicrobiota bacterium]|nr:hypothetical protein [Verrucomicrobiota bacterium]
IAEDIFKCAVNERCDIVDKAECFEEWMSLPAGTVGAFSAMDQLKGDRGRQCRDIRNVLVDEEVAREGASRTSAYMGMDPKQYRPLVKRMLGIGMVKLRRKVKVTNGIFGVWKEKPVRRKGRETAGGSQESGSLPDRGAGAQAPSDPQGSPPPGGPPPGRYEKPGKIRLIVDMRRGNCFFVGPDKVELVTPTALAQIHLDLDEVMVMTKADLDNYFYRCRLPEEYWDYFGLPGVVLRDLGLTPEEREEWAPGIGEEETVFPVLCVIPMGWSHGPLVAQEAHESLLERESELKGPSRIKESRPWGRQKRGHFCYIDDTVVIVVGPRRLLPALKAEGNRLMRTALKAYESEGIPVKPEKVEAADSRMV